jgi:hypothetical protein
MLFTKLLLVLALAAACSATPAASPTQRVHLTDPRVQYRFDDSAEGWDAWTAPGDQALFRVNGGALEAAVVPDAGYIWSLSNRTYRNAAIQATVQQMEGAPGNGFGVLCRADANGNGYYFLISSSGFFSIREATSAQSDPAPLVDWQRNDAIRQGSEPNELLAVCVNDYLTFSVNGRFLAEARDDTHDAGEPGVALGAVQDTAWVRFDNIIVREAAIAG